VTGGERKTLALEDARGAAADPVRATQERGDEGPGLRAGDRPRRDPPAAAGAAARGRRGRGEAGIVARAFGRATPVTEWVLSLAIVAAVTGVAVLASRWLDVPDVEMLFLLSVVLTALVAGRGPSILAAALAVLAYAFLFVPPRYSLRIQDVRYLFTFAIMFGVGLLVGTLTLRLREERRLAVERERRTAALYALTRALDGAGDPAAVATAAALAASEALGAPAVLLGRRGAALEVLAAAPLGTELEASEERVAAWVLEHGWPAGRGTEVASAEPVLCVPVRAWGEAIGVFAVRTGAVDPDLEQRSVLEALARQTALALDRVRLAREARDSALRAEAEKLRSELLSSVSHDLRTPLAAITGAGTTLRDSAGLSAATRADLVDTVCEEAERLARLVSNLLEMTRLESGAVEPRREWVPIVEIVGGALNRVERRLAGHSVSTTIPEDLPLLSADPVLLQQLLVNLLENAATYAPPGTAIDITASRDANGIALEVADRGPGVPPGEEERIFERFQRGSNSSARGSGLGLPIARAIARVHGGKIAVAARSGGGAVFRVSLPVPAGGPASPPEDGGVT
jgi:two-component system sensor histidine kinase KdpD